MNAQTRRAADEFTVGDSREHTVIPEVTRTQIVQFAGASGDYSPLHTDEPHAVRAGYPSVMAHGMLAMGAAERLLAGWVGRERLVRYRVRFVSPVWPGDSLHAVATVLDVRDNPQGRYVDLDVRTVNQHGVTVLSGSATARI
ncbi:MULTISPECIES: MaoC family dehydratase [Mycobacterium]|uniref:MaoC family dehydratase n=1 Tax=Mycobacterium TaxID=1763 RepID=UPI0009E4F5AD|nr:MULTISPECIES: MaoC/PaaZ C-terminal domain-containing protein [Mycobacterium]BCO39272.1 MaoC-like dehydratase [Mycobacterium paraintracellulare]